MKCDKHPENDIVSVCVSCGKKLCQDCDFIFNNKHYCAECKDNPINEIEIQKERQISAEKKSLKSKIGLLSLIGVIWGVITVIFTLGFFLVLFFTLITDPKLYGGSNPGVGVSIFLGIIWLVFVAILILIIFQVKKMDKKKNLLDKI